jgi:glycosyltransferase involved in cell wall biosynthesis
MLIFLTKDIQMIKSIISEFPEIKNNVMFFSVLNDEVCQYLNAADYGILFRENTIMNNVASPTKFAEYMLCGLPVLISEGVGDYSDYTIKHNVGVLIKESELESIQGYDFNEFLGKAFDRDHIATLGREKFSKDSIIKTLILEFKS